jgi:hypothetical protein
MTAKNKTSRPRSSPHLPEVIPELLNKIEDLYSQYTGLEIAAAVGEYRRQQELILEQERLRDQIAQKTLELNNLVRPVNAPSEDLGE